MSSGNTKPHSGLSSDKNTEKTADREPGVDSRQSGQPPKEFAGSRGKGASGSSHKFITLYSYPQAIVHIDGDAFFASVEQAIHPEYKGKPVVTGGERGIIAAASYEAKAKGIKRGIHLRDALRIDPDLIILPTDYETVSLFSARMFNIMRRFTPAVEEYSIDEGFADISGLRRVFRCPYEEIAMKMKEDIERDLGITVSVGLSLSKGLAKICSDFRKPSGFTAVPGKYIHILLERIKVGDVWGIGPRSEQFLSKYGVKTALDFARLDEAFIRKNLGKLGVEIWHELNGRSVYPVNSEAKRTYKSISKFKTFSPPTDSKDKVKAFLVRNIESACIKARRYHLAAQEIHITIRTQDFEHRCMGARLNRASSNPIEMVKVIDPLLDAIYKDDLYRATGVVLTRLVDDEVQLSLFSDSLKIESYQRVSRVIDEINKKFGKHTVHLASSLDAGKQHTGDRGRVPERKETLLKGENHRQRLEYPMCFINV